MLNFELDPHIHEICTDILVYKKGGIIKHIQSPVIGKVDLTDLLKNTTCDEKEQGNIFHCKL